MNCAKCKQQIGPNDTIEISRRKRLVHVNCNLTALIKNISEKQVDLTGYYTTANFNKGFFHDFQTELKQSEESEIIPHDGYQLQEYEQTIDDSELLQNGWIKCFCGRDAIGIKYRYSMGDYSRDAYCGVHYYDNIRDYRSGFFMSNT